MPPTTPINSVLFQFTTAKSCSTQIVYGTLRRHAHEVESLEFYSLLSFHLNNANVFSSFSRSFSLSFSHFLSAPLEMFTSLKLLFLLRHHSPPSARHQRHECEWTSQFAANSFFFSAINFGVVVATGRTENTDKSPQTWHCWRRDRYLYM